MDKRLENNEMEKMGYTRTNRLTGLAPLVLFLSSYLPLFILIVLRQTSANCCYLSWSGINVEALCCMVKYFGMSLFCIVLSVIGIIGTIIVFMNLQHRVESGHTYRITEVSSMNDEPLAYIATYIIPILFEDYSNLIDCVTIVCIFYVIYRLYIRSKLILVNPVLCLKYSIYSVRYMDGDIQRQGVLISRDNDILENDQTKMYNVGHQLFYGYKR